MVHNLPINRPNPFLTVDTTERLVHAFVTSRLDMGNALFYSSTASPGASCSGFSAYMQDGAARLVTRIDRIHHIKPVL